MDKIIKLGGIIVAGTILFGSMPFALYAYNTSVTTNNATYITPTSVTLNGFVSGGNFTPNASTNAWFEYGTDISLGSSTFMNASSFYYGQSGNYSANIFGLTPNTTYYFRAIAQNTQSRVYGNISSFTTKLSGAGNVDSDANSALLAATTEPATFVEGRSVHLNSLVRNNSNKTTVVQTGAFVAIKHADLLTGLSPSTTYYFRAVIENSFGKSTGSILNFVTSAEIIKNSTEKNASGSTTLNNKENTADTEKSLGSSLGASLGANVLNSGSFLPVNIFGWLLLIILTLVLVLLGQHLYSKFTEKKEEKHL